MYDSSTYNQQAHVLEYADVGLMSMYIADCDALAEIATVLGKTAKAGELKERGGRYRAKLATLWNDETGIFLNKDLHTGTIRYPALSHQFLSHAGASGHARTGEDHG